MKRSLTLLAVAALLVATPAKGQASAGPDTVVVASGNLELRGLLWKPTGRGPFPAILFNHGSGRHPERYAEGRRQPGVATPPRLPKARPQLLGPVFARHGYLFLVLFRRGHGLSADQGAYLVDLLDRERATHGDSAANRMQLQLLEADHLDDALAGLSFLRGLGDVDPTRVAAVGHSYGGSLTVLLAERDSTLRAAVDFGGSADSWARSLPRRERLLAAVSRTAVPIFFIQAANDYSTAPSGALAAEMERLGKPHRLKVTPAVGRTLDEGHCLVYLGIPSWQSDVFGFLDRHVKRRDLR